MIKPVNGHLLIEPLKHESFVASDRATYEEIGMVVDGSDDIPAEAWGYRDRVYFDSWLAAKYPRNDKEFYWLVKWEDVRAIEHEDQVPE